MPSWIPNYFCEEPKHSHYGNFELAGYRADHGVFSTDDEQPRLRIRSLIATGVIGPTISYLYKRFNTRWDMHEVCKEFLERNPKYINAGHPLRAFITVMLGEETFDPQELLITRAWHLLRCMMMDEFPPKLLRDLLGELPDSSWAVSFIQIFVPESRALDMVINWIYERYNDFLYETHKDAAEMAIAMAVFFRFAAWYRHAETNLGYLCGVPIGTRTGDVICILKGCDTPVVLRRVHSYYVHIGSCYVDGLMNGEVSTLVEQGQGNVKRIEIR